MVREKTTPIRSLKLSNDKLFDCTRFWSLNGNANLIRSNSSDNISSLKNKPPEEEVNYTHPLSGHPDVPELTELQVLITQALLANEQPCPFDKIFEYVQQRWDGLRRRDGSPYATDCRRAIQANLRISPSHISLFRKVQYEDSWLICNNLQEAQEYARSRLEKKRVGSRNGRSKKSGEFENGFQRRSKEIAENSLSSLSEENGHFSEEEEEEEDFSDGYYDSDGDVFEEDEIHKREANISLLQQLIKDSILRNGGSAKFEDLVKDISKNNKFKKLQRRNHHSTSSDKRQSIKTALTAVSPSGRLFKKDSRNREAWVLTKNALLQADTAKGFESEDLLSNNSRDIEEEGRVKDSKERNVIDTPPREEIGRLTSSNLNKQQDSPNTTPKGSRRAAAAPSLTDMQAMIIRIISVNGGKCHFKTIISEVSKNWSKLRRRDGTAYSSDSVRAVKASLSNNTYPIPIFKKDPKDSEVWMIADKMFEDMVIKSEKFSSIVSIKRKEGEMQDTDDQQHNLIVSSLSPKKRRK